MPVPVSQIYISDKHERTLPEPLIQAAQSFTRCIAGADYRLYTDPDLRDFLAARFDKSVTLAYDQLVPYAYKADLARYCLLYELGGWYVDLGIESNELALDTTGATALFFRNLHLFPTLAWPVANGLMYSEPKNPAFARAIDMIVANCHERYFGTTPLCPTGPSLLGRALASVGANRTVLYGDTVHKHSNERGTRMSFVLPGGTELAYRRQGAPGNLNDLGLAHTNNYAHLYEMRQIYI